MTSCRCVIKSAEPSSLVVTATVRSVGIGTKRSANCNLSETVSIGGVMNSVGDQIRVFITVGSSRPG
jgi:hypothetical protein